MPEQAFEIFTIGSLELRLGKLNLGQLRGDDALLDAVNRLQQLSPSSFRSGQMPTKEQFAMMVTIVVAAANGANPTLTADQITAAIDELPYDVGFVTLAQCVAMATFGKRTRAGSAVSGEAASPSSSTSIDSTGSSPQPSDTVSAR